MCVCERRVICATIIQQIKSTQGKFLYLFSFFWLYSWSLDLVREHGALMHRNKEVEMLCVFSQAAQNNATASSRSGTEIMYASLSVFSILVSVRSNLWCRMLPEQIVIAHLLPLMIYDNHLLACRSKNREIWDLPFQLWIKTYKEILKVRKDIKVY